MNRERQAWQAGYNEAIDRATVSCEDAKYDLVILTIAGQFHQNRAERMAYAREIAERLNETAK